MDQFLWQNRLGPAFWTVSGLISLTVNVILIVILILVGRQLFGLKGLVQNQLVGGLHQNFEAMDQAHIRTTINVQDTIQVDDQIHVNDTLPVVFDLPLVQNTTVKLTEDTPVNDATIFLNGQAVPLNLVLRKGTPLTIHLDLTVPVSQTVPVVLDVPVHLSVPVNLQVPVDIPLNQTELHTPFIGLQNVVAPYDRLLAGLPNSWQETPACGFGLGWLCAWLFNP
jgi:hypothetical protein